MSYRYFFFFIFLSIGQLSLLLGQQDLVPASVGLTSYLETEGWSPGQYQITSSHYTDHNGVTYYYLEQLHQNKPIHKATGVVLERDNNEVIAKMDKMSLSFQEDVSLKSSQLPLDQIMKVVAEQLKYPLAKSKSQIKKIDQHEYSISGLPYTKKEVYVREIWTIENDLLIPGVQIDLNSNLNADHLSLIVNPSNGQIIEKINHTVYCKHHNHDGELGLNLFNYKKPHLTKSTTDYKSPPIVGGGSYKVYPPPIESPVHGLQQIVEDPANPNGSPFGWHDTDGVLGPEYTITRGNNVHAYEDIADEDRSRGGEPDGGAMLNFNFDFDPEASVEDNLDADLTNLFYWNNYMHDWSYQFGFTESAGNFQFNNYGLGGSARDHVLAETLDGADIGNATFSGPRDGENGAMQMHRWIVGSEFNILNPSAVAGPYVIGNANFGPAQGKQISGAVVQALDGVGATGDLCETVVNGGEINGNIALIDRGTCDFSFKVHAAQNQGAIACIICNNLDNAGLISMGAGENAELVTIPSVFLTKEDCTLLKAQLENDVVVRASIVENTELSSAFDNGIVAHEYGHGISLRLVGGRNSSNCLNHDEQMGEGWSDFLALVVTHEDGDRPTDARAIGSYALSETTTDPGIRRYPYSTDMTINPQIHSHVRATQRPHDLGEVWADALWDMYWLLIEKNGFDNTWTDRSSGNFIALQLVFDGMKIQGCEAGMLDARDALITADQLNNQGENVCLIWEAFARRGMGSDAVGGNVDWRYDNVDGFELPRSCRSGIEVTRNVTPIINVGDEIRVDIRIDNYGSFLNEVTLTEFVPGLENQGLSFGELKTNGVEVDIDGSNINFTIGQLEALSDMTISYTLNSFNVIAPDFEVFENFEGQQSFEFSTTSSGVSGWGIIDTISAGGVFAMGKRGGIGEGQAIAQYGSAIRIFNPNKLVKFDHRYDAQLGIDGGVFQVSTDDGANWQTIDQSQILVNTYEDEITFDFRYRLTSDAYTGLDTIWKTSIIDLSSYDGNIILVRFNYLEQEFFEIAETEGWLVDNFEVYDREELIGSSCLSSGAEELTCDVSSTFVNSNARTTVSIDVLAEDNDFLISPNPASAVIAVTMEADQRQEGTVNIYTMDGKQVSSERRILNNGINAWNQPINELAAGIYVLEIRTENGITSQKFVKQ